MTTMTDYYDGFEQNTALWYLARLGLPTASRFNTVMSKGTRDSRSVMREDYLDELTAELLTGVPTPEGYKSIHMERGHAQEPDALAAYMLQSGNQVTKFAFVRNHEFNIGCSPDGLIIGQDGGVEIKTLLPKLMVRLLCNPGIPQLHMPQVQGSMLATGRKWWDVAFYCPHFDLYVERVARDEAYIGEIKRFLAKFQEELEARVFKATREEQTFKALRKLRDSQFAERLEEEYGQSGDLPAPWPAPRSEPRPIKELLQASLEQEQQAMEDGE